MSNIFGTGASPYYIYAPRWSDSSAGIRALHFLCHSLNSHGYDAFIFSSEPASRSTPRVNGRLNTPLVTKEILKSHQAAGRRPIVVYPETVHGNPLKAERTVRLLLNYVGVLDGPASFDPKEQIWAYSKSIGDDYQEKFDTPVAGVIFIPAVNPHEFSITHKKQSFQLVYAGKYRDFVGEPPKVGELESIEIFRDGPFRQNRTEVLKLLASAEVVYCFENSSIVTEAVLSGTPAIFVPNPFLGKIIGQNELGDGGVGFDLSKASLDQAKATVLEGRNKYLNLVENFPIVLENFVSKTGEWPMSENPNQISVPKFSKISILKNKFDSASTYRRRHGSLALLRIALSYFKRMIS